MMRDHGGDLDRARKAYGGSDWLDLSTGINAQPYPMPDLPAASLAALPLAEDIAALEAQARTTFGATGGCACLALAGVSAAIQLVPRLGPARTARVLGPTYNEHAAALRAAGWRVDEVTTFDALHGADLAVVVNPNNPDGRFFAPEALIDLSGRVGRLVVDESFADSTPRISLLPHWNRLPEVAQPVVLRSFGKFYGLAGLRLGFVLSHTQIIQQMKSMAGPWAVSGPAILAGRAAYTDRDWQAGTCARLQDEAARLDSLAQSAGWSLVGGTVLFRTYQTPDAATAQDHLARHQIWTRRFPYSPAWLRLGLPGSEEGWTRLQAAMTA